MSPVQADAASAEQAAPPEDQGYIVGVIGTGKNQLSAGWQISEQLCRRNAPIDSIYLANRTPRYAQNLKEYLELVATQTGVPAPPRICICTLEELIEEQPDITLIALEALPQDAIAAHTGSEGGSWRDLVLAKKVRRESFLRHNAGAVRDIAACVARKKGYAGKFLVYTNPVDVLTYLFLRYSRLESSQAAGFNEGDSARFRRVLLAAAQESQPLTELREIDAYAVGPHNEMVVPVFSQATIGGYGLLSFLNRSSAFRLETLQQKTVGEAQRWLELLGSTSPELAWSAAGVIDAWAQKSTVCQPTLSAYEYAWQENGMHSVCIGQRVSFANGLEPIPVSLDRAEQEKYAHARRFLAAQCARF